MKKTTSFKSLFLAAILVAGSGSVSGETFELVTSADALEAGVKYLLIGQKDSETTQPDGVTPNKAGYYALGYQNTNNRPAIFINETGGNELTVTTATASTDKTSAYAITLEGKAGEWILSDAVNGTKLGPAKGAVKSNYLKANTEGNPTFTIEIATDGKATITCTGTEANTEGTGRNILRFNAGQNKTNPLFACYASGQNDVFLYKERVNANQVAIPSFTPASGEYLDKVDVTLSCTTEGATIRYTTDGSDPTETSTQYTAAIPLTETTTVKAKAFKEGMDASNMAEATYTILKGIIFRETFKTGQGDFTIVDVTKPEGLNYIWTFDSQYGMKANAYKSQGNVSESWLVSPAIDLTGKTNAILSFDHAVRNIPVAAGVLTLQFSTNYADNPSTATWTAVDNLSAATWTAVEIPAWSEAQFQFVPASVNIPSDMQGKANIRFAFKYTSTTEDCNTWEIKNVVVKGENGSGFEAVEMNAPSFFVLNGEMFVENLTEGTTVEIYNALGAKIQTNVFDGAPINVSGLTKGIYVVRAGKDTQKVMF